MAWKGLSNRGMMLILAGICAVTLIAGCGPKETKPIEGVTSVSRITESRTQIAEWTQEWASAQSLDGVDYVARAGINITTPELRVWPTDDNANDWAALNVGCGDARDDDEGARASFALNAHPDGGSLQAPIVRRGEVLVLDGWSIRIVSIDTESKSVHIELLAHPEPGASSSTPS